MRGYQLEKAKLNAEAANQKTLDAVAGSKLKRDKDVEDVRTNIEKDRSAIKVNEVEKQMAAVSPKLIEALITQGNTKLADTLAKNLKSHRSGLNDLFAGGGFKEIMNTVKGSPLEKVFTDILTQYNDSQEKSK